MSEQVRELTEPLLDRIQHLTTRLYETMKTLQQIRDEEPSLSEDLVYRMNHNIKTILDEVFDKRIREK